MGVWQAVSMKCHLHTICSKCHNEVGAVAAMAVRKRTKYSNLDSSHYFQPVVVEKSGAFGQVLFQLDYLNGQIYLFSIYMFIHSSYPIFLSDLVLEKKMFIKNTTSYIGFTSKKRTETRLYPCRPQSVRIPLPFKILYTNIVLVLKSWCACATTKNSK